MGKNSAFQAHIEKVKGNLEAFIDRNLPKNYRDQVKQWERQWGYSRAFGAVGLLVVGMLLLHLIGGAKLLAALVGFVYPASQTLKVLEVSDRLSDSDVIQWCTYWIILALFVVLEQLLPVISYIPFFYYAKMAFLTWCYNDDSKGASVLYVNYLQPLVRSKLLNERERQAASSRPVTAAVTNTQRPAAAASSSSSSSPPAVEMELHVDVASARALPQIQGVDPCAYCVLEVVHHDRSGRRGKQYKYKTLMTPNTKSPTWNELIKIPKVAPTDSTLVISVFNKKAIGNDTFIGKAQVSLQTISPSEEKTDWYKLEDPDGESESGQELGEIMLRLHLEQ